tara:strand:+ start:10083 stop:10628 length:546 start_codon:yes stop_codon:yes gene_type:complete
MSNLKDLKDAEALTKKLVETFEGTISDADGTFEMRNTNRIDIAQVKAEEWLKQRKLPYKNIGFDSKEDRIPSEIWFKLPPFLRCMPDILVYAKGTVSFLEVKGCTDNVKFKIDDLTEYNLWNGILPVRFFIYSNQEDKQWIINLKDVWNRFDMGEFAKYEDNNKVYIQLPTILLTHEGMER